MFALSFQIILASILLAQSGELTDQWFVISPPGVGASVEMPTLPRYKEETIKPVRDLPEILVRSRSSVINNGNTSLTFVYHDEAQTPSGRTKINRILHGAMTGAVALVNGELISEDEIFVDSHKGRDFTYSCEINDAKLQRVHDLKIRTKLVLVGKRLFSLNYISVAEDYDDSIAERFFDSFQVVVAPRDLPPKPRTGRAMQLAREKPDPDVPEAMPSEPIRPDPLLEEESDVEAGSEESSDEDDDSKSPTSIKKSG